MEEQGIPQMIVADPVAIFYLTGKWIFPGERLLALYLNVNGDHKMITFPASLSIWKIFRKIKPAALTTDFIFFYYN